MATTLTVNGTGYSFPVSGDRNWGTNVTNWATAVTNGMLQKAGGSFTLTAEVDFGATYGLKTAYYKSRATNPASAGIVRLGNTETIAWRNAANGADLALTVSAGNVLQFNSITLADLSSSQTLTNKTIDAASNTISNISNSMVASNAAIAFSKLAALTDGNVLVGNGSNVATSVAVTGDVTISNAGVTAIASGVIVNADVKSDAAIAFSKLAALTSAHILVGNGSAVATDVAVTGDIAIDNAGLTSISSGVIVDADVNGSAAIAYSKLNLATSILNADINGSAAIAYSKLNLATSIVNADVNAAAAIAGTKVAPAFGSQNISTTGTLSVGTAAITTSSTITGTASGGADLFAYSGDTSAASMSANLSTRGNTNSTTTQSTWAAYFGASGSNRKLGEIAFDNTSTTVASTGGIMTIRTTTTAGATATAAQIDNTQAWRFSNITTTGSAANAFLDGADSNNLKRSTSSLRYKENIKDLLIDSSKIFNLRAVEYDDKNDKSHHFGMIAEEVASELPLLVQFSKRAAIDPSVERGTAEGEVQVPDGVQYSLLSVLLLAEVKKLRDEVEKIKKEKK